MSVSRIYRLLKLITMLQGGRSYTPEDLARELEVSRRTVFRDLNMLEMAHIPYHFDEAHGGYRIGQHFFLPPVNLTLSEALSLLMLAGRLRAETHLPLLSHSRMAAVKLESCLPAPIREHVGSVLDKLAVSLGPVSRHEGVDELFEQLSQAVAQGRLCKVVYLDFSSQRQVALDVVPVTLLFQARAWYVLAYSLTHKAPRMLKLIRIRKLTVTPKAPALPGKVDLEQYLGDAWSMIPEGKLYDVHLRFARKVGGNVAEVQWHRSQRVEWRDDGSLDFHVRVDGLGEIAWWILGYGDQVTVLSPPPLQQRVAEVARNVAARYAAAEGQA